MHSLVVQINTHYSLTVLEARGEKCFTMGPNQSVSTTFRLPSEEEAAFPVSRASFLITFLGLQFLSPGSQPEAVLSHWEWLGTQGTFFKHCNACSWTYVFSSNKMGLKRTAYMHSWGKYGPQINKETKKPNCHFWGAWSKSGCQEQKRCILHVPCTHHHLKCRQNIEAMSLGYPWTHP